MQSEPTRQCDGCTMCCEVLSIRETDSPAGQLCEHAHDGCAIYRHRPAPCAQFMCGWLLGMIDDKPDEAGYMVRIRKQPTGMLLGTIYGAAPVDINAITKAGLVIEHAGRFYGRPQDVSVITEEIRNHADQVTQLKLRRRASSYVDPHYSHLGRRG